MWMILHSLFVVICPITAWPLSFRYHLFWSWSSDSKMNVIQIPHCVQPWTRVIMLRWPWYKILATDKHRVQLFEWQVSSCSRHPEHYRINCDFKPFRVINVNNNLFSVDISVWYVDLPCTWIDRLAMVSSPVYSTNEWMLFNSSVRFSCNWRNVTKIDPNSC